MCVVLDSTIYCLVEMMTQYSPVSGILLVLLVSHGSAASTEQKFENSMAVIVFNATLPMMQFTIDGTNFHKQVNTNQSSYM